MTPVPQCGCCDADIDYQVTRLLRLPVTIRASSTTATDIEIKIKSNHASTRPEGEERGGDGGGRGEGGEENIT